MPLAGERERISITLELPWPVVETIALAARQEHRDLASERVKVAKALLANRQRRQEAFPAVVFGEPCWDMILNLYIASLTAHPIDVSSLCAASGAPKTTALRHLDKLVDDGLVIRSGDLVDARRIIVVASETLREQIERWIDHLALSLDLGSP